MPRQLDPEVTGALLRATSELLAQEGFAALSLEAVARRAGVGRPAIYRRFAGKAELVAAAVSHNLPEMHRPPGRTARTRLRRLVAETFPQEPHDYVALIGALAAEHRRHPEVLAAFREHVLGPRRAFVMEVLREEQARGELRADLPVTEAVDLLAGPLLARVFAGEDVGPAWLDRHFAIWWEWARPPRPPRG